MTCKACEHPIEWHGDRAIAACDGGWSELVFRRPGFGKVGPVSVCACSGWTD